MPKIVLAPVDDIARKWGDVTPGRAVYYESGVRNPKKDWELETVAAAATYKSAVQNPAIDKLFTGGVKRAGKAKWQRKAVDVGVSRFGPGVSAAVEDYKRGFAPYAEEMAKIEIPPKKPRGSSENLKRVEAIMDALHKKRLALMAVTTTP